MTKDEKLITGEFMCTAAILIRNWQTYGGRNVVSWATVREINVPADLGLTDSKPAIVRTASPLSASLSVVPSEAIVSKAPEIVIQQTIELHGDKMDEGLLIRFVTIPWCLIFREIDRDPHFLSKLDWRKMEELIAAAYKEARCPEVVLTPRSRDRGRDVIATWPNLVSIKVIDQVKTYNPNHVVTADEVRTMLGVLQIDRNVSKGVITTTSCFAPEILKDPDLSAFMPNRLELRDGNALNNWFKQIIDESKKP